MRTTLNIFAMAGALLMAQACEPKSNNDAKEETPVSEVSTVKALTPAERKAKREREVTLWRERHAIELEKLAKATPTYTDPKGNIVYNKAEIEPKFEGGNDAMMKYLNDNVVFPKEAEENGLEATVYTDFVVSADGMVREVVVSDATSEDADQSFRDEAIRVVSSMPKWVPGRQHGKAVDVRFSLPISFEMR